MWRRGGQTAPRRSFEVGSRQPVVAQGLDELTVRGDLVLLRLEELVSAYEHGAVLLKRETHDSLSKRDHDLRITFDDNTRGDDPTSGRTDLGPHVHGKSHLAVHGGAKLTFDPRDDGLLLIEDGKLDANVRPRDGESLRGALDTRTHGRSPEPAIVLRQRKLVRYRLRLLVGCAEVEASTHAERLQMVETHLLGRKLGKLLGDAVARVWPPEAQQPGQRLPCRDHVGVAPYEVRSDLLVDETAGSRGRGR